MGKRGPPPKPAALRRLEDNPAKRPIPDGPEPEAASADAPPPAHLTAEAQAEWRRIAPTLSACGLLTVADLPALEVYCSLYARWREAEEQLQSTARLIKTPNGAVQPNPWLTIARQTAELMKGYLIEFGLTPAARARMGSATPPAVKPNGDSNPEQPMVGGRFAGLIGQKTRPN